MGGKSKIEVKADRRSYPDCINASNPHHECVDYCLAQITASKVCSTAENVRSTDDRGPSISWAEEEMLERLKRKRGSPGCNMKTTASSVPFTPLAERARITEELNLPALQGQLSTLLSNGTVGEGILLQLQALRNFLASQTTIISLENELRTVKSKLDLAVKIQLTAEEKLTTTNLELEAEREKNNMLSGKILQMEGRVAELSEELGDTAVYYTWRTRARIMKQYLEGQTSSWTPKEDVKQFLTFVGKPEDLHLDATHLRDSNTIPAAVVDTAESFLNRDGNITGTV